MGDSFASNSSNVSNTVLPQPTPSFVAEDDDEPPSSGTRLGRSYQMTSAPGFSPLSKTVNAGDILVKDYAKEDSIQAEHSSLGFASADGAIRCPGTMEGDLEKLEVANGPARKIRMLKLSKSARIRALFTPTHPIGPRPSYSASFTVALRYTPINILLVFIPVSWALHFSDQSPTLTFIFSAFGIVSLAALLGFGTEQVALRTSQSVGGLLNATLGNLIEMIISGIALTRCELGLVQSALLGGLLSNLLLVLGSAFMIIGGFKFHHQQFQPMVAQLNSSLLILGVISLIIPQAFHQYLEHRIAPGAELGIILQLSRGSAVILILVYVAYLFFQFYSHNHLFLDTLQESYTSSSRSSGSSDGLHSSRHFSPQSTQPLPVPATSSGSSMTTSSDSGYEVAKMNTPAALFLLLVVTSLAYVTADHLVASLEGLVKAHPSVSKEWLTLILIPIISNAAEHTTALIVASKGKFDLAMSVAIGSCIQIAFLVIPILVLVAWGMGKPLTLLFDPLETVVLFFSVLVVKFSVEDGKSHWMSGLVLLGVYILLAVSFWHYPGASVTEIQGQVIQCSM